MATGTCLKGLNSRVQHLSFREVGGSLITRQCRNGWQQEGPNYYSSEL